jgi:hypothetical protein
MPSVLRSVAVFAFLSAVTALSMPGCSQQGEGERCDLLANGDADCNDGLTCVPKNSLLEGTADRCCPAPGTESDARCKLHSMTPTTGGSGGSGGSSSNTAGAPVGGEGGMSSASGSGTGGAPVVGGEAGMSNGGTPTSPTDGGTSGAGTDSAGVGGA